MAHLQLDESRLDYLLDQTGWILLPMNETDLSPLALIVEDDDKLSSIFAEAFELAGFEVETALNGQVALDRLATSSPMVIVLDLHLPFVSGIEILKQIRQDTRLEATRVIVVTADVPIAKTLESQVDKVLTKPLSFIKLLDLAKTLRTTGTFEIDVTSPGEGIDIS
jgi:DNA-binding response OmpR family regulator